MVDKVGLGGFALFAAKGRIHQHHIELSGGTVKQPFVGDALGEGIAVPDVGQVDAVEHEVGQGDGVDGVVFFAPVEGFVFQGFLLVGVDVVAQGLANVVKAFGQKATCAAAGVVDGLADFWVNGFDHGANHHPWGKELAAVVALFAHFEQQPFVDLREGEDVGSVDILLADGVNFVENVEEVLFGVYAGAFDAGENFADHLLPGAGTGQGFKGFEVGNQIGMEEFEKLAFGSVGEFFALPALG